MRFLLITLLSLMALTAGAQSITKRLRINGSQLEFDSTGNETWKVIASRPWTQNYVATHGGGAGDTSLTAYTASNGLTLTDGNFTVGGALEANTTITGPYNFNFGAVGQRLSQFNVYGSNGVLLQDNAVSGTYPTLQLSSGNFQLYGRAGTILSTQNLSITSGGVTSFTGEGLVFNPTDSINISITALETSADTTNDKPLVITRSGRLKQGSFNANLITSVFGRTGVVTATEADYQSYYPRLSQSYANPSWIASLPVNKITFAGTSSQQLLGDGTLATKITDNSQLANGAGYLTNITGKITAGTNVVITGSGTTASPYVITSSGGSGASWGTISGTLSNQTDLNTALSGKEPSITSGTTAQYWRGDKTFQPLNTTAVTEGTNLYYTDARARAAITLTTTGTSGAATYVNGVLNIPNYATGSGIALTNLSATAPLSYNNSTGNFTTSIATGKLVGRSTSGTGVMEEISVGATLSLSSGTLNVAATGKTLEVASTGKPYSTITTALAAASSGDIIVVYPGTYNETGMVLKNGVNFYFHAGAKINSTTASGLWVFRDNGVAVTATIDGYGEFIQASTTSGTRGVFDLTAASTLTIRAKLIRNLDPDNAAISLNSSSVAFITVDSLFSSGSGIDLNDASVCYFTGRKAAATGTAVFYLNTTARAYIKADLDCSGVDAAISSRNSSYYEYTGTSTASGYSGLDVTGSSTARVYNARITSTSASAYNRAIDNPGTTSTLILDNVELTAASASTYSIQAASLVAGTGGTIYINSSSKANKPLNPNLTVSYGRENLLVATQTSAHAPLDLAGKVPKANLPTETVYNNQNNNFNGYTIENYTAKYNDQTGTTYTLLSSDNGKILTFNNAGAVTVTVPSGLPVGFNCMLVQKGAGQVTLTASSTTINNRLGYTRTAGQYAVASIISVSSNIFISGGDLSN